MTIFELKEQMQEDMLTLLESFGVKEAMEKRDWDKLSDLVCDTVIEYITKCAVLADSKK